MTILSELTKKWDLAQKETFGVMAMYEVRQVVGMFSGGHDSLLAVHLVSQHPLFWGVIWADTGTGTGETRRYIRETCARYGWALNRQTVHPLRYEAQVMQYGFPSPVTHRQMYTELKAKPISKGLTDVTARTKTPRSAIAQVTGLRKAESTRRMSLVNHYHEKRSKTGKLEDLMINPIFEFSKTERDDMIQHLGLVRNAYADKVGHSYECMCYANAVRGEREYRAQISPEYEEIEALREQMVALAYRIQQLKLETGMIDPEDKTFLSSINITQGWHLDHKIADHSSETKDPFVLCAACIPGTRAADGMGGVDPDLELQIAKINQAQKMLEIEVTS